ncbi:ATP-binding protein [Pseudoduganella sp. GCM10020061]|uniref:ATP-binding protein n=1 Tax=Pseudoduganella sp. GCM10020061 TaxID=3317345 RepID=UPI0036357617
MNRREDRAGGAPEQAARPPHFVGEGEMVERVNALDWAATPAGAVATWPESIRTAVSIALNSTFQLVVLAGRDLVYIYNDASSSIFGAKHPWALGKPTRDVWEEIWPTIGPMLHSVLETGRALRYDDLLLVLKRHGFEEEAYFTFSYSPIREPDGTITGLFLSVLETSERYINERRMRTLTELAARVAAERSEAAYSSIADAFEANPDDVPSAAMFLKDRDGELARCVFARGACSHCRYDDVPLGTDSAHPVARAFSTGKMQVFETGLLSGPSGGDAVCVSPASRCVALPLMLPGRRQPNGVLVLGVNPRKDLDAPYKAFFRLAAGHVATAVANAEAARMEKERLEALAELDQAKTAFFANASHELRTPLTLIEGPLGMLLEDAGAQLPADARELLEMARRNTARMKVLVDSLLDFARIEAGKMEAHLEEVDLGALTGELASLFRSGFHAAGVEFEVRAYPRAVQTMVDSAMWEKIVLNLLSNALKYTPSGRVELVLGRRAGAIELTVRDTGIGIAADDLPHVTDRFYRGRQGAGRPAEGTGLGLALVSELARLHEGSLSIDSRPGQGTLVTVRLPDRMPERAVQPRAPSLGALTQAAFASTAPAATRPERGVAGPAPAPASERFKLVVIDDNDDILRYIERLLNEVGTVVTASSASAGLDAIRSERPDLVLLDVMMPEVDGFELLARIRAERAIQSVPVIVLSAHAGEHARLEAMAAGADDYLAKPFSGRELVATVRSHFKLARLRRAALEREDLLLSQLADIRGSLESLIEGTSDAFVHIGHDLRIRAMNNASVQLAGRPKEDMVGRLFEEVRPDASPTLTALREAMEKRCIVGMEYLHKRSGRWFNVRCYPTSDGAFALGNDITARKEAEASLRLAHDELERRVSARTRDLDAANEVLKALFDRAPAAIAMLDLESRIVRSNRAFWRLTGYGDDELRGQTLENITEPDDFRRGQAQVRRLLSGELTRFDMEVRYLRKDGETIWADKFVGTIPGDDGRPRYLVKIVQDITARKRAEQMVRASQSELRELYERLQSVRKDERIALAREVHDHLGQLLSAAKIDIKLLLEDVQSGSGPVPREMLVPELRSASDSLEQAIGSVRSIARDLRPPEVENQGLYAAIRWHAQDFERRTRIRFVLELPSDQRGPSDSAAGELFRIFQEALTNVLRHAMATEVVASVQERGCKLLLRVRDNGVGIERNAGGGATLGLVGMRERAALSGGRVLVGPLRPRGTLVSALLPRGFESRAPLTSRPVSRYNRRQQRSRD